MEQHYERETSLKTYPNINAPLILECHNQWRRGKDVEQMSPKLIGYAIDLILLEHADMKKALEFITRPNANSVSRILTAERCLEKIAKRKGLTTDARRKKD